MSLLTEYLLWLRSVNKRWAVLAMVLLLAFAGAVVWAESTGLLPPLYTLH